MNSSAPKEKVAIVRYDGTYDSFAKALDLCDGLENLRPDDKVLLKPNILWGGTRGQPQYGRVTTSTMVGYTLKALRERGCRDLVVGEGTIPNEEFGSTTARGFSWTGIDKVARRYGARLVDFNSEPFESVELGGVHVNVSSQALDCDFLIDLPVLKTHRQTKVSLGMKNLKGLLAIKSKQRFHRHGLHHMIALLGSKLRPSLTIIDGIYALEKGPELLGTPRRMDLIIAGTDVFSCDCVGASVMGILPTEVDHLREYAQLTGRSASLDGIEIRGESVDEVARSLEWQISVEDVFRKAGITGIAIQPDDPSCCSGCAAIQTTMTAVFTKDVPNTPLDAVEVVMGRSARPKAESKTVLLLGDCAVSANKGLTEAIRIRGCPPPAMETVLAMAKQCLPRRKAAKLLATRSIKTLGMRLGVYHESFPAFGDYSDPAFNKRDF